jgi:hypothetical protein
MRGGKVIVAAVEEVVDLIVGGEETLRLPGRLEALHLPLSSACRLVGVFGSVIEPFMLPMRDAGHDLPLCGPVARQLIANVVAIQSG